jgi:prefoldin subunit 5
MAEAVRIKVDKNVYQTTLNNLDTQIENLKSYQDDLQNQINRLNSGNTFGGSDVKDAIEKAETALEKVKDGISRVTGYRMAIQQQLTGVEQAASQLSSDMANIDLPNMFG